MKKRPFGVILLIASVLVFLLNLGFVSSEEDVNQDLNSSLLAQFGYNEGDCDSDAQCFNDGGPKLYCDGNAPGFDFEKEGCCFIDENWNLTKCEKAVTGKIYGVNQSGQKFLDSPYKNLKLKVFIKQEVLKIEKFPALLTNTLGYFEINTTSDGEFKFNPERYVGNVWNWDDLLISFQIQKILALENGEVIGGWTNQFSNKEKYQIASESVDQVVRIHKDKKTWRKEEIPTTQKGELSIQSTEKWPSIPEEVLLIWNGNLTMEKEGNYNFQFNVSGDVVFLINNETVIDTKNNMNKNKKATYYLDDRENSIYFEFEEDISRDPIISWSFENNLLERISEKNWIKLESKIIFHPDHKQAFSILSSDIRNDQPDYMVSFLEKPEILRKKDPLVFVHGKHGESGYWDRGNSQNLFNKKGYDSWEFYYPGSDYINVSGALLGDALDYLKREYYSQNQKFDIISHSMGGLVSRSYIQNISPYNYQDDINHLVMIGTPNYGNGVATGIAYNWTFNISLGLIKIPLDAYYWNIEEKRLQSPGISNSPIYRQMSLGSNLVKELGINDLSTKSLVIIGNEDRNLFKDFFCTLLTLGHKESSSNAYDCLVAISSSSLLSKGIPLAIINGKTHQTVITEISDYFNLIMFFLQDSTDINLASNSFAYYNPKTEFSNNFFNQIYSGTAQIKFKDVININETKVFIKNESVNFWFIKNIDSNIFYHFNRGEFTFIDCVRDRANEINFNINDVLCIAAIYSASQTGEISMLLKTCVNSGLAEFSKKLSDEDFDLCLNTRPRDFGLDIPQGSYDLYVNGKDSLYDIEIKPAQTLYYEVMSCKTNWTIQENWSACTNKDLQFKDWRDQNVCELNATRPQILNQTCDFCLPNWTQVTTGCLKGDLVINWFNDTNNCFAKTNLNSDLLNKPANITHKFSCDHNKDGIIGNISDINTTIKNVGFVKANTSFEFRRDNDLLVSFEFNLANNSINFADLFIEKQNNESSFGYFIMKGLDLTAQNKTKKIYIDKVSSSANRICIKDEESLSITEISDQCTNSNEISLVCPGTNSQYACNITSNNTKYEITGLRHSAVREYTYVEPAPAPAPPANNGGSSGGGGGGGGGGSSVRKPIVAKTNQTLNITSNQTEIIPLATNEAMENVENNTTTEETAPVTGATIGTMLKRYGLPILIFLILVFVGWTGVRSHIKKRNIESVMKPLTISKKENTLKFSQESCKSCGKVNSSWRRFCITCGASLRFS